MTDKNNNMNGKDFIIGTLVGSIIGAAAALLLAPKSGRELRVNISDGYQSATKKTQQLAKNVGQQTESIVGKVKEVAGNVKGDVQKWKSQSGQTDKEVKEEIEGQVGHSRDEAAATVDQMDQKADQTQDS